MIFITFDSTNIVDERVLHLVLLAKCCNLQMLLINVASDHLRCSAMLYEKSISFSFLNALESATAFEVLPVDCDALFEAKDMAPPLSARTVFVVDLRNFFHSPLFTSSLVFDILKLLRGLS